MAASDGHVFEGALGVCKKGGRVEKRHFVLYHDRLDYFSSKADLIAGVDPRGRIALTDIAQCEEFEDGFSLRLAGDRGLEVKVYEEDDLSRWLDALEPLLADDEEENATSIPTHPEPVVLGPPVAATSPRGVQQDKLKDIQKKLKAAAYDHGGVNWQKLFNHYDKDRSGEIDFVEFRNLIRKEAKMPEAVVTESSLKTLFASIDPDNSGKVSIDEFLAFLDPGGEAKHAPRAQAPQVRHETYAEQKKRVAKQNAAMTQIRNKLKAAAYDSGGVNLQKVFKHYDRDNSGQIDFEEFRRLIRKDAKIPSETIPDADLKMIFSTIDGDNSGEVETSEFMAWLDPDGKHTRDSERSPGRDSQRSAASSPRKSGRSSPGAGVVEDTVMQQIKNKLKAAAYDRGGLNFSKIFNQYDKDHSGEMDLQEFRAFLRKEAKVTPAQMSDDTIKAFFGTMDDDNSGMIALAELKEWIEPEAERIERENARKEKQDNLKAVPKDHAGAAQRLRDSRNANVDDETETLIKKKLKAASYHNGKNDWERLFKFYDRDNSGEIDFNEFKGMVRKDAKVTTDVASDDVLKKFFNSLDPDKSGKIEFAEFADWLVEDSAAADTEISKEKQEIREYRAKAEAKKQAAKEAALAEAEEKALFLIRKKMQGAAYDVGGANWTKLFSRYDKDRSGYIDFNEFKSIIRKDGKVTVMEVSDDLVKKLFLNIDLDDSGSVSQEEFVAYVDPDNKLKESRREDVIRAAKPTKVAPSAWNAEDPVIKLVRQKLKAASYHNGKLDFHRLFKHYDKDNSGEISFNEFKGLIRKDGKVTAEMVSDAHLASIFQGVDDDNDGVIQINEFVHWIVPDQSEHVLASGSPGSSPRISARAHAPGRAAPSKTPWAWDVNDSLMQTMRLKLKAASYLHGKHDLVKLFLHHCDKDSSGEMGFKEFLGIIRKVAKIDPQTASDRLLKSIFKDIDENGSGVMSSADFCEWVSPTIEHKRREPSPRPSSRASSPKESPGRGSSMGRENMDSDVIAAETKPRDTTRAASPKPDLPALLESPRTSEEDNTRCEGFLCLRRKGKEDRRYFVLFEDRLEYYMDAEAAAREEKRGMVMLAGVSRIEETDTGFVVSIAEADRSLDIGTETDEETNHWLSGLESKLTACDLGAILAPRRRHETLVFRFAALELKDVDQKAFTDELLGEFRGNAGISDSLVSRLSVRLREGSIVAEVFGHAPVVQELRSKALERPIVVMGSSSTVVEPGVVASALTPATETVVSPGALSVTDVSPAGFAEVSPGLAVTSPKSDAKELARPRFLGLKKDVAKQSRLVFEGECGVLKKGAVDKRHLFLFTDRFECFNSTDDFKGGSKPRSRVLLQDVLGFEVVPDGFDVQLPDRVYQLRPASAPEPDVQRWFAAWAEVFDFEGSLSVPQSGGAASDGGDSPRRQSVDDGTKKKRKEKKEDGGVSPEASTSAATSFSSVAPQSGPGPVFGAAASLERSAVAESLEGAPVLPTKDIVQQGPLAMQRKGKSEPRHFVLYAERLEYFTNASDMNGGGDPRGRVLIRDVKNVHMLDLGFGVELEDRTLTLNAGSRDDFEKWQAAFTKVMKQRDAPQAQAASAGSGPQAVLEAPKSAPRDLQKISPAERAAKKDSLLEFMEGKMIIEQDGKSDPVYVVVKADGVHIYENLKAKQKGDPAQAIILKTDVTDVEVQDDGFLIEAQIHSPGLSGATEATTIMKPPAADLEAWTAALGSVFEDAGSPAHSPKRQEEQLPHRSQLQQAPHSPGKDSRATSPRSPRKESRLVWQSMLEVQEAGRGVWKYFALYEDSLVSFNTASDMAQGLAPEGRIPLKQVQDVKVGSMGFVLQFQSFNLAFRVSSEPRALDAWVTALHQVLVFNTSQVTRLMHQGPLELLEGGHVQLKHFCLYHDRLEYFGSTGDAVAGKRCQGQVSMGEVVGFKVLDSGFIIRLADKQIELRVVGREDLEVWLGVFRNILAVHSRRRAASGVEDREREHSVGTPSFGNSPQDVGHAEASAGKLTPRRTNPKMVNLRFPSAPWPLPAKFEAELRTAIGEYGVGANLAVVDVRLDKGFVTAQVKGTKDALEDFLKRPPTNISVLGHKVLEAIVVQGKIDPASAKKPAKTHSDTEGPRPLHQGFLGIQHGGCLASKYFLLFKDRLDYHDTKEDALSGLRPRGRIALAEVNSYEAYGSGFILKLLGRSVGLHVGEKENSLAWTNCLNQALRECAGHPSNASLRRGSWGAGRVDSKGGKGKGRDRAQRSLTPAKTSARDASAPADGFKKSSSEGALTVARPGGGDEGAGSARPMTLTPREALSPGAKSNASKCSLDNASSASSVTGWQRTNRTELRVKNYDGNHWKSGLAPKVAERNPEQRWLTRADPESAAHVAEKVTGDRLDGTIRETLLKRSNSVPNTHDPLTPRRSPGTPRSAQQAWDVTGKVNEAKRTYKKPDGPDRINFSAKVTEAARDSTSLISRGRAVLPDKVQTIVPSRLPSAPSEAAGLCVSGRQQRR